MKLKSKKFEVYKGQVIDLQVKSEDHSYNVNNLVVHNSVGGSLVAYLLDIITVDAVENDLLFERFLNAARVLPEKVYEIELENGEIVKIKQDNKIKLKSGVEINIEDLKETDDIDMKQFKKDESKVN